MLQKKITVTGTRGIPDIQGGVETHCGQLYPRLASRGCDIILARRTGYVEKDRIRKEYRGVKLKDIYAPRSKSFEAVVHTFLSVCYAKKIKADIVHIHAIGPALLAPLTKLLGLKVVFTHHGADYERRKWGRIAKFILKLGEKAGVRYADRIIAVSEVIGARLTEKYGVGKNVSVIHNGIEKPVPADSAHYIHSLGLESRKYIFTLGRFVEEKGFHNLVAAYIGSKYANDVKLVIAGDADHVTAYSEGLKKEAIRNGVVLTGTVKGEQLSELFSHALLFVLPSFHEGLSISLLEAMSYGLPVLASDIPANALLIKDRDVRFEPSRVEELTEKLNEALSVPFNLKEYDLRSFDWNIIAEKTARIYDEL